MKKMRKEGSGFVKSALVLLVMFFASISVFASGGQEAAPSKDDGKPYVALVCKGYQHQYWQQVKLGAEAACEELGATMTFEAPETEAMVDKQIEIIEIALSRKPDVLAVACLDSKAVFPIFEKAKSMGIPVLTFDSGSESPVVTAHLATDAYAASALAGEKMIEMLNGKGKVAVISGDQTSLTHIARRDGFVDKIKKSAPGIEIVDVQYSSGDDMKALDITTTFIQSHPDLSGIFVTGEPSANGAVSAFRQLNIAPGSIKLIGFDAGKKQKLAVQEGLVSGSITQNPYGIGYKSVETALKVLAGESVPAEVDTGYYYYTVDNMDDPEIAGLLYD